jgi:hypothetical protein
MNRQPNPGFPAQMEALERTLAREPAVVVSFTGVRNASAGRGEPDPTADLPLRIRDRQADGVILCAALCPE